MRGRISVKIMIVNINVRTNVTDEPEAVLIFGY
jgi:hypothetical protein